MHKMSERNRRLWERSPYDLKIYGAGIISSHGETEHSISNATPKFDFDVDTIFNTAYRTDIMQDKYCVIDSFHQLYDLLEEIRELLPLQVGKVGKWAAHLRTFSRSSFHILAAISKSRSL